ncbi:MAG: FAD-dependent monooxygenase [Chloroflexaceae bacterium]|nr:FAD-dependent monooxygenase [Chloroflexaceae bacterium]
MARVQRVIIIGGGIGGIAAALACQRVGLEVQVYERADAPREQGAGLWLWANALHALEQLGLAEAVRAAGIHASAGRISDWRGRSIVHDLAEATPTVALLRGELLAVLRQALPARSLRLGAACCAVAQDGATVTAQFSDGSSAAGDVLIGADGVHSLVRAHLHGPQAPCYAGFQAYRAVVAFDHARIAPGVSWGVGMRVGMMPLRDGRVNWFAARNEALDSPTPANVHGLLLNDCAAWHAPIADLISATDPNAILRHAVWFRAPLRHWGRGRITLLGDAAHPLTPSLGQGACLALEDALMLATSLRDEADAPTALQHYERMRKRRTAAVARQAQLIDWLACLESPVLAALRNRVVRQLPAALRARRLSWIVNYHSPAL